MLTFSQFLKEAGNAALPFDYDGVHDEYDQRYHRYSFINDGRKYRVNFAHHDMPHPVAIVNFADYTDRDFGDQNMTGRAKHSAVRVLSTVHNIVKHHLSKHPEIEEVHFSSSPDEPSRGRLYSRYTEKHGGITDPTAYDTLHVIPARSYGMSEGLVVEAGDAPLAYTHENPEPDVHSYRFNHGGVRYDVDIHHEDGEAEVSFSSTKDHNIGHIGVTGHAGASAPKIMGTIHNIVSNHVKKYPRLKKVNFTSDNDHESRVKLYTKYTSKLGGRTLRGAWETYHEIPADSYRRMNESEDQPVRIRLGKTKGEQAQKFMVDFADDSDEHPFNPAARILHGSVVHVSRDGNQVHIHDIQTLAPKSGAGTKALKHLTSLADKHGVKLNLFAKAYSNRPEHIRATPKLIKWYEKHGFKHDEPDYDPDYGSEMTYYPK